MSVDVVSLGNVPKVTVRFSDSAPALFNSGGELAVVLRGVVFAVDALSCLNSASSELKLRNAAGLADLDSRNS